MIETRTPAQLRSAGITKLPCGFSLARPFKLRIRHYRSCPDPYCQDRFTQARGMARQLAESMRANKPAP